MPPKFGNIIKRRTMRNPFQYGKIAEKENFIDRDTDRAFLKQMLYSNMNVILDSPRRWGKSSLVKQAMKELCEEETDVRVCFIDAFPINSSAEFYRVFSREVLRATATKVEQLMDDVRRFLKSVSPKVSFNPEPMTEFSLSFDFSGDEQDEHEILALPENIAKDKNIRLIVCIDEFQKLAKLSDYEHVENMMRSVWQHHQNVSYCLYGSQRHMIKDIFDSTEKPFYKFGQIYHLKKIPKADWLKYIKERFEFTGKTISDALAERITDTVECHSWYVQQLASAVWNFAAEKASEEDFDKALTWCVDVNSEGFHNTCDALSEAQLGLLKAIALGETSLSSASIIRKYHLGSSAAVTKNKKMLDKADIIRVDGKTIAFHDPIFKVWFLQNY